MNHSLYILSYITKQLYNGYYIIYGMKQILKQKTNKQEQMKEQLKLFSDYKRKMLELYSRSVN